MKMVRGPPLDWILAGLGSLAGPDWVMPTNVCHKMPGFTCSKVVFTSLTACLDAFLSFPEPKNANLGFHDFTLPGPEGPGSPPEAGQSPISQGRVN